MGIRSIVPNVAPWNVGFRGFGLNIVCISVMNASIDSGRRKIESRPPCPHQKDIHQKDIHQKDIHQKDIHQKGI
jgi:hypothetical protein